MLETSRTQPFFIRLPTVQIKMILTHNYDNTASIRYVELYGRKVSREKNVNQMPTTALIFSKIYFHQDGKGLYVIMRKVHWLNFCQREQVVKFLLAKMSCYCIYYGNRTVLSIYLVHIALRICILGSDLSWTRQRQAQRTLKKLMYSFDHQNIIL